jgi:hypothetical protein
MQVAFQLQLFLAEFFAYVFRSSENTVYKNRIKFAVDLTPLVLQLFLHYTPAFFVPFTTTRHLGHSQYGHP